MRISDWSSDVCSSDLSFAMAGSSTFNGVADFGGGSDTLTIGGTARFTGTLANSAGLAVGVSGGTFDVGGAATIASLDVTDKGVLAVTLDGGAAGTALTVTGHASFHEDSKLPPKFSSIQEDEGSHIVVPAGSLSRP